ncbi:hypothetical protein AA313_de0203678 [Arthrobotrys entomopaga]|nr:hypothetical protein AA313_de0203678 [Arthrobotrys entomopaga]
MKSILLLAGVILSNVFPVAAGIPWKESKARARVEQMRQFRQRELQDYAKSVDRASVPQPTQEWFLQKLDHFDPSNKQVFWNRYFVQDAWYKPGGPVIFQDIGEFGLEGYLGYIEFDWLMPVAAAKKFGGLLIQWEHRYYGSSYPQTNVSQHLGSATQAELTDFFQYLTMEQALEDVPYFASSFSYKNQSLTPDTTPWVFIGCSYSGNRGAWLAKRNPGLFKATLASSAPVQQQMDFWQYFRAVTDDLAVSNQNCSADLHAAATWMSDAYTTQNATLVDPMLSTIYGAEWDNLVKKYGDPSDSDTLWSYRKEYMEDVAWAPYGDFQYVGIQYGILGRVCQIMETAYNPAGTPEGVFATETLERAVAAYAKGISGNSARESTESTVANIDSTSWFWQFCTEVGGFQVSHPEWSGNLLPSFMDINEQLSACVGTFGLSSHMTWSGPNVGWYNDKYGGWNIELPNTFWTNGEFDPWRQLSIESPDAPKKPSTHEIPKCGETFAPETQLRYVIKGGHHGSDLAEPVDEGKGTTTAFDATATKAPSATIAADPKSAPVVDANNAQNLWFSAIASWIPCTTLGFTYEPPAPTTTSGSSSGSKLLRAREVSVATATPTPTSTAAVHTNAASSSLKSAPFESVLAAIIICVVGVILF